MLDQERHFFRLFAQAIKGFATDKKFSRIYITKLGIYGVSYSTACTLGEGYDMRFNWVSSSSSDSIGDRLPSFGWNVLCLGD